MSGKDAFWKGEEGQEFAKRNPPDADGTDAKSLDFIGIKTSEVFEKILEAINTNGKHKVDFDNWKILDIGCSTGGKLSIMEKLGFNAKNLYGVDMSPKALEILEHQHPDYKTKMVSGISYKDSFDVESFDIVYHTSVGCQIRPDDLKAFFDEVTALNPKFYLFMEPKSDDGEHHVVDHAHMPSHGHHKHKMGEHHAHALNKEVKKHIPDAREIFAAEYLFKGKMVETFKAMRMDGILAAVYEMP